MKNNKPEVVAYIDMLRGQDRRYASLRGDIDQYSLNDGDELIRLSDYEALQAEYEQLVSYTKNGIKCFANPCSDHSGVNTPPFSEFQERYGQLCLMCVVDERDALLKELSYD